jgi:hypothetical protein
VDAQPYNAEIETVILHTIAAIGDVKIKRFIRDANWEPTGIEKKIDVPLVYSPKSRTVAELTQVNGHHSYPFMSLKMTGVSLDNDRQRLKDAQIISKQINGSGGYPSVHHPVPIKITTELEIVTVFEEDMLQILNNFIAYMNPYISVSWKEPYTGQELITKVTWSGDASYEAVTPLASDQKSVYKSSTTLIAESYIFREEQPDGVPIRCFDMNWYTLSASQVFFDPPPQSAVDSIYYCSNPCVNGIYPTCVSAGSTLNIYGSNLDNVDAVFFMGASSVVPELTAASSIGWAKNPDVVSDNYYDLYQYNQHLSADNPPFYGLYTDDYEVSNQHHLTLTIPQNFGRGLIDIRLASMQAGYTDITNVDGQGCCVFGWVPDGLVVGFTPPSAIPPVSGYGFSLGFSLGFNS